MKRFKLKGSKQDSEGRSDVAKEKAISKEAFLKPLKIIIYALIILICIRGIGTFFRNDTRKAEQVYAEIEAKLNASTAPIETETAKAFAESFTKDYLTYSNESAGAYEYSEKLKKYIANYLYGMTTQTITEVKKSKVVNVYTWEVEKIKETQGNIIVRADLVYEDKVLEGDIEKLVEKKDTVYLKVPIMFVDGEYVVDDYPVFNPVPDKAEIKYQPFYLQDTSNDIKNEVSFMLQNFFKTYCSGNEGELSYYMMKGNKVKGYEGRFELVEVKDLRTLSLDETSQKVLAVLSVKIKDTVSNLEFVQKYHLETSKKDGRWYIEKFDIRGGNLEKYIKKEEK